MEKEKLPNACQESCIGEIECVIKGKEALNSLQALSKVQYENFISEQNAIKNRLQCALDRLNKKE